MTGTAQHHPSTASGRALNVRRDTVDFRDKIFLPTLTEVPTRIDLKDYLQFEVPVLDQGTEGACTGFGLATVINYLSIKRKIVSDRTPASPWMLYEMARRYDEWAGEDYEGSSARGAMKGWHKHGICRTAFWQKGGTLTPEAAGDAEARPLGAYFRVNHKDLVAMHTALAEVGILYATADVHTGWDNVGEDGIITQDETIEGGHAFALVAYDADGFWLQNSWGDKWGRNGFAHLSYDDWLANGNDVWVARLGAPVHLSSANSVATRHSATTTHTDAFSLNELRRHLISLGNDGALQVGGTYGAGEAEVRQIFTHHIPEMTRAWKTKRILLFAHGGLVGEEPAVQHLADARPALLAAEVYPISFIWHSDAWSTLTDILKEAVGQRRSEGVLGGAMDFMLDRLDDALEPLARIPGKALWDEMKENATRATTQARGGARLVLEELTKLVAQDPLVEIHVAGHSAGSIFHAPLLEHWTRILGQRVASCTLWAPACTVKVFKHSYLPAIQSGAIERFALFTLSDKTEQDDNCGKIYNKSLLYLVSNAFEDKARIPLFRDGCPILGMEKFIRQDKDLMALWDRPDAQWILAPNGNSGQPDSWSTARHHGDFDDDEATVRATLARICDAASMAGTMAFAPSQAALKERRSRLG